MTNKEDKPLWIEIAKLVFRFLTILATVCIGFFATTSITNTIQQQIALQEQIVAQEQIANQEIVTLQPRDGDVIIRDEDSYKLVQLIKSEDITVSDSIQESRYSYDEINIDHRVELFRQEDDDSDWSERDGFKYTLENISINPDKVMNLIGNIVSIKLYFDVYEDNDITTRLDQNDSDSFAFVIYDEKNEGTINTSFTNITSDNYYVTKAINNGINYMKLRLVVGYRIQINDEESYLIKTEILLSDWLNIIEKY